MPRPFTEQERATIRARLLERSQRLFETRGLRKTSIDEIANEAGISKGAFYQFFDSKEALCLELLESIESKLRVGVLEQAVSGGRGAKARVARILEGFARGLFGARQVARAGSDAGRRLSPPRVIAAG